MPTSIVTVWQGGQLVNATALPQWNATSGYNTLSIQITNNSDVVLIYRAEKGVDIIIPARYQVNAALPPNDQYSISLQSGQTGTPQLNQSVTVIESDQESTYASTSIAVPNAALSKILEAYITLFSTHAVSYTAIPNCVSIMIKAQASNTQTVFVSQTLSGAIPLSAWPLAPGEVFTADTSVQFVVYGQNNSDAVWVWQGAL